MLIGLTGSIAAGKSTVAGRLSTLGAYVLDADAVAREVVEPGTDGLARLCAAFGREILSEDGTLDRKRLAGRVFSDPEARGILNGITHPLVVGFMEERAKAWLAKTPGGIAVWDMPLLIECGAWKKVDAVWLVTAEDEARLARMMARDGCTREHALLRMAAQMPQAEKARYADVVIPNDGDEAALLTRVDACYAAARRPEAEV